MSEKKEPDKPRAGFIAWHSRHRFLKAVVSMAIVSLCAWIQWLIWPSVEPAPYLLFYPAVIFCALVGDGPLGVLISVLLAQYLFIEPIYSLELKNEGDLVRALIFVVSSLLVTLLTRALRRALKKAESLAGDERNARHMAEELVSKLHEERELRERFVATLTHDLRSPLSAARTGALLLSKYPDRPDARDKLIPKMLSSLDRIEGMLQNLLDVSRIKAGKPLPLVLSRCDLYELTHSAVDDLKMIYGDRLRLTGNHAVGQWSCHELRRVIENLVDNALKYGAKETPVDVHVEDLGDQVAVHVTNQVSSADEALTEREITTLFEPFQRSESAIQQRKKGWGLGLTLVQGLTQAHGGEVRVKSAPQSGTTFSVILPRDARPFHPDSRLVTDLSTHPEVQETARKAPDHST